VGFVPSGSSRLFVTDTLIAEVSRHSASAGSSAVAVMNFSSGSSAVTAVLNRVSAENNWYGIGADGSTNTGPVSVLVTDSVIAGNDQSGISAVTATGKGPTVVLVRNSSVYGNGGFGVFATGPGAAIRLFQSSVMQNATGWIATVGGSVTSYDNNTIDDNAAGNTAPPLLVVK